MQSSPPRPPSAPPPPSGPTPPSGRGPNPLATRGGTLAVSANTALVAAAALLVFLHQYKKNLTKSDEVRALVVRNLLPKGTPGRVVANDHLYREVKVRRSDLEDGAVTDPNTLVQKVVTKDVYPGHQLTSTDFAPTRNRLPSRLSGYQRAMTVPVDPAHGMIGKIQAGDRVDVVSTHDEGAGPPVPATVVRNVLVLAIPSEAKKTAGVGDKSTQSVTLRVPDQAGTIPIASGADDDGGGVWLVLRPPVGARSHSDRETIYRGVPGGPVQVRIKKPEKKAKGGQ